MRYVLHVGVQNRNGQLTSSQSMIILVFANLGLFYTDIIHNPWLILAIWGSLLWTTPCLRLDLTERAHIRDIEVTTSRYGPLQTQPMTLFETSVKTPRSCLKDTDITVRHPQTYRHTTSLHLSLLSCYHRRRMTCLDLFRPTTVPLSGSHYEIPVSTESQL